MLKGSGKFQRIKERSSAKSLDCRCVSGKLIM